MEVSKTTYRKFQDLMCEANQFLFKAWFAHTCGKISGCTCKKEDLEERFSYKEINLEDIMIVLGKDYLACTDGILEQVKVGEEFALIRRCKWILGLPANKQGEETIISLIEILE